MEDNISIAKELIAVAKLMIAGEVATKDGKYGKRNEGWSGTINYNGTRGTVSNAVFELKNGRIIWTDGTWHNGRMASGRKAHGRWVNGKMESGRVAHGCTGHGTTASGSRTKTTAPRSPYG